MQCDLQSSDEDTGFEVEKYHAENNCPESMQLCSKKTSTDNIILVQEIVHSMKSTKKRKGFMAIKIDLEKAYDRVRWDLVVDCVRELGVHSVFEDLVRQCLMTTEMQVFEEWHLRCIVLS